MLLGEIGGARIKTKRAHARADRAAGDDHDFLACLSQRGDLRDDLFELCGINLLPAVREDAGAELDHDTGDVFEQFRTHGRLVANDERSVEAGLLHPHGCS